MVTLPPSQAAACLLTLLPADVGLGAVTLAAHTVVKNIVDYANNIFGTFSTVAQSLVASELGKVKQCYVLPIPEPYVCAYELGVVQLGSTSLIGMQNLCLM